MIPLTFLEYELKEQPDEIFSRLKWNVEEVEYSWFDNLNKWSSDPSAHKKWIGQISQQELWFSLEEPENGIRRKFNVVLEGRIEPRASTTNIKIKLGLDNMSFLWIAMLYLVGAMIFSDAFTDGQSGSFFMLIIYLAAYPALGTYLIKRRMNRAERNLDLLFA